LIENDTLDIFGIDFNNQFKIVAEDTNIFNIWNLEFNFLNNLKKDENNFQITFDSETSLLYLNNYESVNNIRIYNIKGNLLFETKPSSNIQDLRILNSGQYIISFYLKNNKIINKKILKI